MLVRFRPHLSYANVMATIAVFIAIGGGALAATSFIGSDGKIHGCVSKKGRLTVLKPGKKCTKGQTAIAWNQRGPAGQNGQNGLPGQNGAQGGKGDQGPPGSDAQFNGAAAGNDLTGTYPNPSLALNAVTSAKVQDGSLTLADTALTAGSFTDNLPSLAAHTCNFTSPGGAGVVPGGKLLVVTPAGTGAYGAAGSLTVTPAGFDAQPAPLVKICNVSTAAVDPPSETFNYAVFG